MSSFNERLANVAATLPIIIMTTLLNVLIASVMGIMTYLQLQFALGWTKLPSEITAVLVAVAVHLYIWMQPKIRNYLNARST